MHACGLAAAARRRIDARNGSEEERDGTSGRRRLAGSRPRHRGRGRHVRAHQEHVPQLGDAGRRAGPERQRRLSGGGRALSPLCRPLLPLGAPHLDLPRAEEARRRDLALDRLAADAQRQLGLCRISRRDRGQRQRQGRPCRRSISRPIRASPAASPCRCCGTRNARRSSTTSRRKSSACSIRRSTRSRTSKTDYYPAALRAEIDEINAFVYANVNNGVYRAGFARTQAAYEAAFRDVFGALDTLEERLSRQRYLVGKHDHRGRLAAVRHAGALRCRLLRAVQVQSAPADRLSEPVELSARSLCRAGRRRDGRPARTSSRAITASGRTAIRAASCRSVRRLISRCRMTARGSRLDRSASWRTER